MSSVEWGQLWVDALVERVGLDQARVDRGRTPAKIASVGQIEIEPGFVRASVDGSTEATPSIGVKELPLSQWLGLVNQATREASLSAALLSGDVPMEFAERLLPDRGDVHCDCTCSDGGEPCVHAASLLHAVGELFATEPFALVLLRGRGRNDLITELRSRRAESMGITQPEGSDLPRGSDPETSAADAWRRQPIPLESAPRTPLRPGSLVTLAAAPPSDSGINVAELRALVEDAATRAHGVLTGDGQTGLELGAGSDVVRRAASGDVATISEATKVPFEELASAAQAWQFGGQAGLRASRRTWDAPGDIMQPGVEALGPDSRVRSNRVSAGRSQLRLDEDGLWWLFEADDELGWVLCSDSATDPADLGHPGAFTQALRPSTHRGRGPGA